MGKSVDLSRFTEAINKLSRLSGKDLESTMKAEVSKVLETAIRYTPKADREKIKSQVEANTKFRFENQDSDAGTIYKTKKTGKTWFTNDETKAKWYLINDWRVPVAVWAAYLRVQAGEVSDYTKTLARRLSEALARRGLTAKTWVQIALSIGAPSPKCPSFIHQAAIPEGVGRGRVEVGAKSVVVTGENSSKMLISTRTGQGLINRAIQARVKFIETAIRKGALASMATRAKSFPHLFKGK